MGNLAGRNNRCKFPLAGKHLVVEKRKRKPAWLEQSEQRAVEMADKGGWLCFKPKGDEKRENISGRVQQYSRSWEVFLLG